jgi:hypothetical protein
MRSLRSVSHTLVAARRLESPPFRAGSVNELLAIRARHRLLIYVSKG